MGRAGQLSSCPRWLGVVRRLVFVFKHLNTPGCASGGGGSRLLVIYAWLTKRPRLGDWRRLNVCAVSLFVAVVLLHCSA